jgi:hypothetical protein
LRFGSCFVRRSAQQRMALTRRDTGPGEFAAPVAKPVATHMAVASVRRPRGTLAPVEAGGRALAALRQPSRQSQNPAALREFNTPFIV